MPYGKNSLEGRFLAGEPEAYGIVVRWVAQVLTLPRFRLVRSEWADLHQEALRRVIESLRAGRFDASLDLRVYVQGIARYTAREALLRRLRAAENGPSALSDLGEASRTEELVLADRIVKMVLEKMPEGCRGLFYSLFYQELSHTEIAGRLGVPLGTVKSRLHRCLQRARELITGIAQDSSGTRDRPDKGRRGHREHE